MLYLILFLWLLIGVIFLLRGKYHFPNADCRLRLPLVINPLVLALCGGSIAWQYLQNIPESFPDFIGGFLAMSALPKSFEYYSFYIAISVFIASLLLLAKLYSKFQDEKDILAVREISLYALIIPALLIGQSILSSQITTVFLYPAISVGCGILVILAKLCLPKLQRREMCVLLLGIYFGLASHFCIRLFCNRITFMVALETGYWAAWMIALFFAKHRNAWNKFLVISQCGLPLAFGNLLFPTQILQNTTIFMPEFNSYLSTAVTVLILSGYLTLYIAFRKKSGPLQQFIPSLPLAGLICLFCAAPDQWGNIGFDDYHNGEIVLPWFLFQKFGYRIYVDYIPSRGVVNYIPGFLLWLFKGHDFSYLQSFIKWADLPLYVLAITVLRRRSNLLLAVAGCAGITILTPHIGSGLMFGLICWAFLSSPGWTEKPSAMLLIFFAAGLLGTIYSLTDALPIYTAMMPLVFYMLYRAWQQERKQLTAVLCGIGIFLFVLLIIPVFRKIIFEMLELLFLQSGTYTTAHCVPLMKQNIKYFNIYYIALNYGFLLLIAVFCSRLFLRSKNNSPRDLMHFFSSASLVISGIIMIQRAGGRAGCDEMSRTLFVTLQMTALVLPVWLRDWNKKRIQLPFVLILCILFGMLGNYSGSLKSLPEKFHGVLWEPQETFNPSESGLPHLGSSTVMQRKHYQHHLEVKALINSILPDVEENGGFLDMTNNSTIYAYCGSGIKPPMSYPSYFYLGSVELAEKMKKELQKANPVLVLIKGKNIEFYEGTIALRSYPLYTFLMDNYRVFGDVNGKTWMIRKGCEELLKRSNLVKPDSLDDQNLLSDALDYKKIDGYPISWARSINTLQKRMTKLASLQIRQLSTDTISLYETSSLDGDFLHLKFNRPVYSKGIVVSWQDSFSGAGQPFIAFWGGNQEFLIPLYTSTNWYLSAWRSNLIVQYEDKLNEPLQLLEATLYKRKP